jgi:hypothetical protein
MEALDALQGSVRSLWLDQSFGKTPLVLSGQAEDGMLINGAMDGIMICADDDISEAASLKFCRSLQRGIVACRWACFEA